MPIWCWFPQKNYVVWLKAITLTLSFCLITWTIPFGSSGNLSRKSRIPLLSWVIWAVIHILLTLGLLNLYCGTCSLSIKESSSLKFGVHRSLTGYRASKGSSGTLHLPMFILILSNSFSRLSLTS